MAVAPWLVPDGLWAMFEPLLPKVERRFRYPGRKRLDDRAAVSAAYDRTACTPRCQSSRDVAIRT